MTINIEVPMDFNTLTYNGKSFNQRAKDNYVNLGQLCSTHGKKLAHWKATKQSDEYLVALSSTVGITVEELMYCENDKEGTWGHPLVAIEVARWISADFGVWANQHIKTLMETGITSLKPVSVIDALIASLQETKRLEEEQQLIKAEQERAAAERATLTSTLSLHTEQISNIYDRLATLSEFVSTPVDTPEQTIRNLLAKAFQELGSILAEQGEDKAKAYSEPWRELGLEMRNSALKYDLNARYSNEKKKHKEAVNEWKGNGSPRGHKPKGLSRPDILERDGKLAEGFKFAKKIVQQYISKLS